MKLHDFAGAPSSQQVRDYLVEQRPFGESW